VTNTNIPLVSSLMVYRISSTLTVIQITGSLLNNMISLEASNDSGTFFSATKNNDTSYAFSSLNIGSYTFYGYDLSNRINDFSSGVNGAFSI